ncbi:MAG: bacillithiol biosynthesis cysteine-adding enzyme BshC [Verrucomicrobiota bacterium]
MSEAVVVPRAATARESNAAAALRGLWGALDTTQCGHPEVVRAFLEPLPTDRRIVDIGCWNGAIAGLAAASIGGARHSAESDTRRAPWRSYVGLDIVPGAVAEFRRAHRSRPRTRAIEGDVRALPLADASADVVLCLFVLQDMEGHRADGVRALGELHRIAQPAAELLIGLTVHSSREEETFYVVRQLRREGIPEKPTHHWRHADFLDSLRDAGFRITRVDEFGPNERGFVELYCWVVRDGTGPVRTSPASSRSVPVGLLPGLPPLFVDYVGGAEQVADLFAHDFRDDDAFARAARAAAARPLPRDEVADVLLDQNRCFGGGPATVGNVERLRERACVAVVTGQQPALFGGPLYNLYKAATAIRLSRKFEQQTGRAHVPLFWIANDDHELRRVDHVHVQGHDGAPVSISWAHGIERRVEPIGAVKLDGAISEALARLAENAPGSPHLDAALDLLGESFRAGEGFSDAFARLLAKLFEGTGLVVVDPRDPRLRRLGMPKLEPELNFPSPTAAAALSATAKLAARGYPIQVPVRNDRLNLFSGVSERFRIRCGPAGFQVSRDGPTVTAAELRSRFRASPEEFSPNVLLRPLYQDLLFPTAAYVAGPSEVAYFAQLKPVYERFELPMPVVYPRKSFTLANALTGAAFETRPTDALWARLSALPPEAPAEDRRLAAYLLPGGELQERTLGIAHGLIEHGPRLASLVLAELDLEVLDHQLLLVGADTEAHRTAARA